MKNYGKIYVNDIELKDIPEIELYVDQIITLLNKYETDEEKYLTKSMINNYSKAKIIEKIKGRKYSQSHVIIIAIINRLKQTLTINEINTLMLKANSSIINEKGEYKLSALKNIYEKYRKFFSESEGSFEKIAILLNNAKENTDEGEYLLIKALCLSAISQNLQIIVKKMITEEE